MFFYLFLLTTSFWSDIFTPACEGFPLPTVLDCFQQCLVAFPAQLNPNRYSSPINIMSQPIFGLLIFFPCGKKNQNTKWVLKLLLPYLKNPRELLQETATINRKHGNYSSVLKLDVEFVQQQTPWGRQCLLLPAALSAAAQLAAQPSE